MKLYADDPSRRVRQIVADVGALLAIALMIWVGVAVHGVIAAFGVLGTRLAEAGTGFGDTMRDVGESLGGVPLIGSGIAAPFESAAGTGDALVAAGESTRGGIEAIAVTVGLMVSVVPIAAILLLWLVPRLRFALRAGELSALVRAGEGTELLALRALVSRPLRQLAAVHPDAAGAWRRGEPGVAERLAALELRRAGVAAGPAPARR